MTLSPAQKAILWLTEPTIQFSETESKNILAFISDAIKASGIQDQRKLAAWIETQAQLKEKISSTPIQAAYKTIREILSSALLERKTLEETILKIYAAPDCINYYRSREGLWLMSTLISRCLSAILAENKEVFFSQIKDLPDSKAVLEEWAAIKQELSSN